MEGTRLQILQLLQKNGHATVEGLATGIGLAPATIRRHLDILQRDRLVGFEEVRKKTGRPEYSFCLTEDGQEALPKNYDKLLKQVVGEIGKLTEEDVRGNDGSQILHEIFVGLSEKARSENASPSGQSLKQRVEALVTTLGSQDFSPVVEKNGDVIELRLMNCPFRSVAMQNQSICSYDFHLIASTLKEDIARIESIRDGADGCLYRIMATPEEVAEVSLVGDG